jgi:small subunit ribosomal protein S17
MIGKVSSDKMDKTIVVTVNRRVLHPLYKKYFVRKSTFHVHDPKNECKTGDTVEILESRPLSKLKRWTLKRVIEKAV